MLRTASRPQTLAPVGTEGRAELGQGSLVEPCPRGPSLLNQVVHRVGHSIAAYTALGTTADTFQTGGCWMFAEALQRALPGSSLKALMSLDQHVQHVVVEHSGRLYDSDGGFEPAEMIEKFSKEFDVTVFLEPFRPEVMPPGDVVSHPHVVAELERIFVAALEPNRSNAGRAGRGTESPSKASNPLRGGVQTRPLRSPGFMKHGTDDD